MADDRSPEEIQHDDASPGPSDAPEHASAHDQHAPTGESIVGQADEVTNDDASHETDASTTDDMRSDVVPPATGAFDLPSFDRNGVGSDPSSKISFLSDVDLKVKIELGRSRMYVEDVLRLDAGSVVELDKPAGDPVDIFVNDRHIARGEVLVVNDNFCVRVSEIIQQRAEHEDESD